MYQYSLCSPKANDDIGKIRKEQTGKKEDVSPRDWSEFERFALSVMHGETFNDLATSLSQCDIVLINGEGCIYDRTRQSRMIFFIAYLAKRFFDKPTAMVNHSIVMNDPVLEEIAWHVYPLLDDIVFREGDSARACPAGRGRVAADAAYLYAPQPQGQWCRSASPVEDSAEVYWHVGAFDPQAPYACIGGGSVYFRGLRPGFDAIPGFLRLCRALQASVGQVMLTASSAKDMRILEPVAERLGLPLAGANLPVQTAVNLMGNARVYIGARWHPSIFAHRGGTPVIALSRHTPKMDAFLQQAEMPPSALDPFALEDQLDAIMAAVRAHLYEGEELRDRLHNGAARLASLARENVRLLT
ncbi:polysaccharide pyruvyl transferase family protein [Halomonas sp. CS7]|uniref:Polysaccharide pyruvyl transferase family protein n=1 Tax=Halomonas pelophila TaxID=3151122 RepID=A0ABV1N9U6_9GAMM